MSNATIAKTVLALASVSLALESGAAFAGTKTCGTTRACSGDVIVGEDLRASILVNNDLTEDGSITVDGDVLSDIAITGDCAGDVIVGGELRDEIVLSSDLTEDGSITVNGEVLGDIVIGLDCAGDVILNGHLSGDVDITDDLTSTGSIVIDDSIKATGRILVDGLLNGEVSVGTETVALSQIRAIDGLGSAGCIIINADEGAYDANGTIYLGPIIVPDPPPGGLGVTFDGGIKIFDAAAGGSGDLEGAITVMGCHATSSDLDICVDGNVNGNIALVQAGCTNQVSHSCVGGCN